MRYKQVVQGTLIKRMNRFVAEVSINDSVERVHVKNTGRLKELLYPDNKVLLEKVITLKELLIIQSLLLIKMTNGLISILKHRMQ